MSEQHPPVPPEVLRTEAEAISRRYKVTEQEALEALEDAFAERPELARRIRDRCGKEDVTRWRDYRDVVKSVRRRIYYRLRRYYRRPEKAERLLEELEAEAEGATRPERIRQLGQALLATHVSTSERLDHYDEWYEEFFELVGVPATVLDVGCGMHPLSYPFEGRGGGTELYVAVEKERRALRALRVYANSFAPGRLLPVRETLGEEGWLGRLPGPDRFEVALLLKVVPVLGRLDAEAVARLHQVPADRVLVTGSTESMTRREGVERRERGVLERFIAESRRCVLGEFRVGTEFGFALGSVQTAGA